MQDKLNIFDIHILNTIERIHFLNHHGHRISYELSAGGDFKVFIWNSKKFTAEDGEVLDRDIVIKSFFVYGNLSATMDKMAELETYILDLVLTAELQLSIEYEESKRDEKKEGS